MREAPPDGKKAIYTSGLSRPILIGMSVSELLFEHRGFLVLRENEVVWSGIALKNYTMEKRM